MCTICNAFRPMDKDCFYRDLNPEKFVPPTGFVVAYDVTAATGNGQVSDGQTYFAANNMLGNESGDAANGQNTAYGLNVSATPTTFNGSIETAGDRDWIEVELTAGEVYAFEVTERGSNALDDSFLRLRDADGNILKINDDAGEGFNASIFFEATQSGTYYIDVGAYINTATQAEWLTGDYALTVTQFDPGNSVVSYDELADYLTDGFWETRGGPWDYFDGTTTTITVDIDGLTAEGQQLAKWAMQSYEMFLDIEFDIVSSGADIVFDDEVTNSAYAAPQYSGSTIDFIEVNVGKDWVSSYGAQINDYTFQTYIHEIGHALGLGHQGDYNGSADFEINSSNAANANSFLNDNWLNSVMSYFNQDENPFIGSSYAITISPMLVDIIALQDIYGAPTAAQTPTAGNTVWGKGHSFDDAFAGSDLNQGSGSYLAALFDFAETGEDPNDWFDGSHVAFTIYDAGGEDLIDFSFDTTNQIVSLEEGSLSTVFNPYLVGRNDNMWIARGTTIEDFSAGAGDDSIDGNDVANEILGNDGDDTIFGGSGNDTLWGGQNDDVLDGSFGSDQLYGQEGADVIDGGASADTIVGGAGNDTLTGGLGLDLLIGDSGADQMDGGAESDQYFVGTGDIVTDSGTGGFDRAQITSTQGQDIDMSNWSGLERISGGIGNDTITGTALSEDIQIFSGEGNDVISGGAGNDVLIGGGGNDQLFGGSGNDTLLGNEGNDTFSGGAGNDVFYIGESGDVITDAGTGTDKAVINTASGVDLEIGTWLNLERIVGLTGDDTIDATGMSTGIVIVGGVGDDVLTGGNGNDSVFSGANDDVVFGGQGNDVLVGGAGADTLNGGSGNDFLKGDGGGNEFVFETGWGADTIADFQDGTDIIDFSGHAGVTSIGDLVISSSGSTTTVALAGGTDQIILGNFNGTLTDSDFNFL